MRLGGKLGAKPIYYHVMAGLEARDHGRRAAKPKEG